MIQKRKYLPLIIWLACAALFVSIYSRINIQFDFTQDKRFTVSQLTKKTISDLTDTLSIEVFLPNNINPGFNRLHLATSDLLAAFKSQNKKVSISIVNPEKLKASELIQFKSLIKEFGLLPVNVVEEDNSGKVTQKSVFPFALLSIGEYSVPVELLVNNPSKSGAENLDESIQQLEYRFMDALRLATDRDEKRIAFLEGNGELDEANVYDITETLSQYYAVDRGSIDGTIGLLDGYSAIIIAAPTKPFSELEKFVLDQYLMQGGKLVWLLDGAGVSADSLRRQGKTLAFARDLNLNDQLFTYGVSLNNDLILDLQCATYPVNMAAQGAPAQFKQVPWHYAPLFSSLQNHPISRNVKSIKGEFASSLRLVESNHTIRKTVLLRTSAQTNVLNVPVEVDLALLEKGLDSHFFNQKHVPTAVLLEGEFKSVFLNRMIPAGVKLNQQKQKFSSPDTKMLVISDGNLIKNEVRQSVQGTQVIPLGFDLYTGKEVYGNKTFLVNAINYLCDEDGLLQLRMRKSNSVLLDKVEINERRAFWQSVNVVLPLLTLALFVLVFSFFRRKGSRV